MIFYGGDGYSFAYLFDLRMIIHFSTNQATPMIFLWYTMLDIEPIFKKNTLTK